MSGKKIICIYKQDILNYEEDSKTIHFFTSASTEQVSYFMAVVRYFNLSQLLRLAHWRNLEKLINRIFCVAGQGRLDGAFCYYTEEEKFAFLNRARNLGVANIEMEAVALAAITHQVGIKTAVICVTILDRLKGDQVSNLIKYYGLMENLDKLKKFLNFFFPSFQFKL